MVELVYEFFLSNFDVVSLTYYIWARSRQQTLALKVNASVSRVQRNQKNK